MQQRAVNDFTIRVATVNGSGSQSSNLVLTNAIFRLGIPVAPKNVFPSNIEGLPTWFDVRVSSRGYQCRTRDVDVLVALNPATWRTDVASVKPGGAIVHESAYPIAGETQRDDVTYYAVPFNELAKKHVANGALRKYLLNMIYVGVLGELLGIDEGTIEAAVATQFRSKPAAVVTNMDAVRVGIAYAREHCEKRDAFIARTDHRQNRRPDVPRRKPRGRVRLYPWVDARLPHGTRLRRRVRCANRSSRLQTSIESIRRPANARWRSFKPKTNSPRSAWSSAPGGPARAR